MDEHSARLRGTPHDFKLLCSVDDVASMLSIGRIAAWQLIWSNCIRSVKIGRARRVPLAALQEYVNKLMEDVA